MKPRRSDWWTFLALVLLGCMAVLGTVRAAEPEAAAPKLQLVAVYIYSVCGEVRAVQSIEPTRSRVFIKGSSKELDAIVVELTQLARLPGFGVPVGEVELQQGCTRI